MVRLFDSDPVHDGARIAPVHGEENTGDRHHHRPPGCRRYSISGPLMSRCPAGITGWLKDNALPLIIFVIGLGLLGASRKGDTSRSC